MNYRMLMSASLPGLLFFSVLLSGCGSDSSNNSAANLSGCEEDGSFCVDTTPPSLTEVAAVTSPATVSTPSYVFHSTEAGSLVYGGDCSSLSAAAVAGNNTLKFNLLIPGTHSNCTIQVKDAASNLSQPLQVSAFIVDVPAISIAHVWNEALLSAIRKDRARPPVHARNLFHTSAAMYDVWAGFESGADTYLLGQTLGSFSCPLTSVLPPNTLASRQEAISFAMYHLIKHRYSGSPGIAQTTALIDALMTQLGYDKNNLSTDYSTGSAAALGNYVAQCYIDYGLQDGSNEIGLHANTYYKPVNAPLIPTLPGVQVLADLDRWQPITLDIFIDQSGNVFVNGVPPFVGAEWGNVAPFALDAADLTVNQRDSNGDTVMDTFNVYHDPGAPPSHLGIDAEEFKWNFALVAKWSGHLDPADGVMIDISPASIGNDPAAEPPLPATLDDYHTFYDEFEGGDSSTGHAVNPKTGLPYTSQIVPRGDYVRVLTEFWADGPNSETPPGHWFSILNYVTSQLDPSDKRFEGQGIVLDDLEWDVKTYFTLGGAMHDAAISAWGIKGWYDFVRPITAIRSMDALNMTLEPGYIEEVLAGDPLAGANDENVGKIKIRAWRGPMTIVNPATDTAGVDWILAENWWPAQRPTFVTPPFAGYVSGHSTFSRAGADVMTAITGDPYFPSGKSEFHVKQNDFLVFEDGPSVDITLEWATYRDASDQCSLSRIWGGIHPPFDDIPGRVVGSQVAVESVTLAKDYFDGKVH